MRIFPTWCYICHRYIVSSSESTNRYLCRSCYHILPFQSKDVCGRCGQTHDSSICTSAWAKDIVSFHAIFKHEVPVNQWISGLKYSQNLIAGNILTLFVNDWLLQQYQHFEDVDFAIPIPLHSIRLRARGFNQSAFLLRKQRFFPVDTKIIRRVRNTPRQAGLSKRDRHQNLNNAFRSSGLEKGKTVLLFDDVCTSGQTLCEATRTLLRGGVGKVCVLVVSRAR